MRSKDQHTRDYALLSILHKNWGKSQQQLRQLALQVTSGDGASRAEIQAHTIALLRKGPAKGGGDATIAILKFNVSLYPGAEMHMRCSADREMLWYQMAAFRRCWCMVADKYVATRPSIAYLLTSPSESPTHQIPL